MSGQTERVCWYTVFLFPCCGISQGIVPRLASMARSMDDLAQRMWMSAGCGILALHRRCGCRLVEISSSSPSCSTIPHPQQPLPRSPSLSSPTTPLTIAVCFVSHHQTTSWTTSSCCSSSLHVPGRLVHAMYDVYCSLWCDMMAVRRRSLGKRAPTRGPSLQRRGST